MSFSLLHPKCKDNRSKTDIAIEPCVGGDITGLSPLNGGDVTLGVKARDDLDLIAVGSAKGGPVVAANAALEANSASRPLGSRTPRRMVTA